MAVLPLPPLAIDADPGTQLPAYSGASFRAAFSALLTSGASAGAARTGALDQRAFVVSLAGTAVSAAAGGFAVGSGAGVYLAALTVPLPVGTLAPADPTNARADRVVLRIDDPTNGGGTGRAASVEIITGTPSAVPSLPSVPGTSVYADLARIDVPRSGAGSPAVTDLRKFTAVAGGVVPFATKTELDAWVPPVGAQAVTLNDGALYTRRSGAWMKVVASDDGRLADTGWVAVTLKNGWTAGGSTPVAVRKVGSEVRMRGALANASASGWSNPFDLPAAFRPPYDELFPMTTTASVDLAAQVGKDGKVQVWCVGPTNSWRPLRGIRYETD